ncbi:MAG: SDR family oxidoreductase [Gillisia sp.]
MWNLKNKKALITGGTKGIGRASVIEFAELGAQVLFVSRNQKDIENFSEELKEKGFAIKGLKADVSREEDLLKIETWIRENWGSLDILVNNAGMNIRKKAAEYSEEEVNRVLSINLLAPFNLSIKLYPFLKKSSGASIINVSSVAATQDVGTGAPYGMAKAGLLQQTRSLATEWAKDGIRVNAVSPWFTETPLTQGYLGQQERLNSITERTPLGRVARAEEMSSLICFLAMEKSSYVTGQNIIADGGMSISAF